ncbi:hypothetical protein EIP86_000507 [Pleurotus ostreatoroseus]|nr:hypothetical protein EIP86_000507 [Pleurotus ostreatoroseus]
MGWFWSRKRPANRKYIDLIFDETSLWASYMPFKASPPKVGDYGSIDRQTGEFEYQGNIYESKEILAEVPELKENRCQPVVGQVISKWVVTAKTAKQADVTLAPTASVLLPEGDLASVAEASIDVEVAFRADERGAVLAMYQPRTTDLPKDVILGKLSKVQALKSPGIYLVTKVVSCPAYALQISDKGSSSVRVKFVGQLPISAAPGVTVGGQMGVGWKSEHVGSSYQEACNVKGEYTYCPLFSLKQVRPKPSIKFRQAGDTRKGDDTWVDIVPPWAPLDEEGDEIPYEDDFEVKV